MAATKKTTGDYTIQPKETSTTRANLIIDAHSTITAGNLSVGGSTICEISNQTTVNSINAIIDSFPAGIYRSAKYIISVSNSGLGEYQTSEVLLTHNGSNTVNSTLENVYTGANVLVVFTSNISSGVVNLIGNGVVTGNTVKVQKTYLTL
jgi:hypothetical protein